MRSDCLLLVVLLGLVGCPRGGANTSGTANCGRSVHGDVATARARLEKGRVTEALLYVDGLVGCDEALAAAPFLQLAMDVYEEAGRLNEAWSVGVVALERVPEGEPAHGRLLQRITAFEAAYAVIVSPRDGRDGLRIDHRGPVADQANEGQLKAIRSGRGVLLGDGQRGYWLFPGSYLVEDKIAVLQAGDRFEDPRP